MKIKEDEYQDLVQRLLSLSEVPFMQRTEGIATATVLGVKTDQRIRSLSIYSEEKTIQETVSDSAFVHTAFRCIREKNNLNVFVGSSLESLSDSEPKRFLYQDYLSQYGILPLASYQVRDFETKTEFSSQLVEDGNITFGFLPYDLRMDTILSYEEKGNDSILILHPDFATKHYQVQMLRTGGLTEKPIFRSVMLTLKKDDAGKIIGYTSSEVYHAKLGIFSLEVEMNTESFISRN